MVESRIKESFEKALKRLTLNIDAYNKDADLAYLEAIAQDLRSLLCDRDNPYLIKYAKSINYPLYVIHGIPERDDKDPGCVFSANFTPIGTQFMTNGTNYSLIEDFLSKVAFRTPEDTGDDKNFLTYRTLIKRVCEKDGISHLDERIPKNYAFLKEISISSTNLLITSAFIRPVILNLGKWAQIVINFFLGMFDVRNEIQQKLKLFTNIETIEPADLPCTFDQVPYLTANLYFEGNNFGLTILDVPIPINEGVCLISLCKILPQIHIGKRSLFEFQNEHSKSILKIELDEDLTMTLDGKTDLLIQGFKQSKYFNKFCVLGFNLHSKYFEFFIDGEKIKSISVDLERYKIKKVSYPAGIDGSNPTSSLMAEVTIINSFLAEQLVVKISKSMYQRFNNFIIESGI